MHVMVHFLLFITIFLSSLEQAPDALSIVSMECTFQLNTRKMWVTVRCSTWLSENCRIPCRQGVSFLGTDEFKFYSLRYCKITCIYIGMSICIPWVEPLDTTSHYPKLTQNHDCIYVMKFAKPLNVPLA